MVSYSNRVILYLFIISSGIINFSFVPNTKLSISFYILALIILFIPKEIFNKIRFDVSDIIFLIFLFVISLGGISDVDLKNITQPMNFVIFWVYFKIVQGYFSSIRLNRNQLLEAFYYCVSILAIISLIMFAVSFPFPNIIRSLITVFNNANAFDLGGISIGREVTIPRNTGLSPEPSFWSSLIALNIAVFYELKKKNVHYFLFVANFSALLFTFGRTGYFVFIAVSIATIVLRFPFTVRFFLFLLILAVAPSVYIIVEEYLSGDLSAIQRFDSLFFAVEMWQESPIFGHGLGSFERISLEHGKDYRDVFSLYFNILYSGGIIGLMLFILYIYAVLKKVFLPISLSILTLFLVMPAYNLTFVWVLLAINSIDRNKLYVKSNESASVLN
ncbi:hypothetical protein TW84_20325 [Vibrio neptunius]|uniref:O-antigen ligase family protein n=1 Tax=Vibrio neptunius TaxID=170651 RepID=UPI0005FA2410|nr:O-antigen ligase family protein [Vibrio neptunius]KJY86184.1 hypothetical protein TW84_20325 [Vibrio neptunius]